MDKQLISKKTLTEFQEFLVGTTLREIKQYFESADIIADESYEPRMSGQRRSYVEQFYHSLNLHDQKDVRKLLNAYEFILIDFQDNPSFTSKLIRWLERDGYRFENNRIIPSSPLHSLNELQEFAERLDAKHLLDHLQRIQGSVETDPSHAIGASKELIETTCKTILDELYEPYSGNEDVISLVKLTLKHLKLLPEDIPEASKGSEIIRKLLKNLAYVAHAMTELRNLYGTGHGKSGKAKGVQPRHARMAVSATGALVTFLIETHEYLSTNKH